MKRTSGMLWAAMLGMFCLPTAFGQSFIIRESKPCAEIIIAEQPPRMVKLAAEDLQTYIEQITGAKLPITTAPGQDVPVQIYVGKSPFTDKLGVTDVGLKYGAFRMVSGDKYLVLLGHDSDFTPMQPYLRNYGDIPRLMAEWDKVTGEKWGFPLSNLYKQYNGDLKIWEKDERGSFNAVCEFLRMQGVRWYLPGKLGEIVPKKGTIELPRIDKTVRPDFALRYPYQAFHMFAHEQATRDEVLWQLRLGLNQAPDLIGDFEMSLGHGITPVHARDEVKQAHPEYYALFNGKRDTTTYGEGRPCLSSQGLFEENVKYVRKMFDLYDAPMVSVMPQDGYSSACECPLCAGKSTPERGWSGQISDYVWDYVNRVAIEVYKTHPNKKISCLAYGTYALPPTKIAKLSPNLAVGIAQARIHFHDPEKQRQFEQLRKAWLDKMPGNDKQLWTWEYYLYGRPGVPTVYMPVVFPHTIARDLRSLKGVSMGDFIEVYRDQKVGISDLATSHLNIYVTSRLWWDADQDIDALLEEYYTLYYGPAREEMKAFLQYAEANFMDMGKKAEKIQKVFDLLGKAQQKAPPDSVYAQRIALIADYIKPMKDLQAQLGKGRENVPEARAIIHDGAKLTIDGRLDEEAWQGLAAYGLSELQTGRVPVFKTSFKALWIGDSLYLGITCEDVDTKRLDPQAKKRDDMSVFNGDCVEIELETQNHSYYQFAVSPAGTLVDLDREDGLNPLWTSGAEVATQIGEKSWTIEIRIPVAAPNQTEIDALNGVSGRKPTEAYPWYVNVCRQRIRENDAELSAFSPTGKEDFHVLSKFAKLYAW